MMRGVWICLNEELFCPSIIPRLISVALMLSMSGFVTIDSHALTRKDDPTQPDPDRIACTPKARIEITLSKNGLPLIGSRTNINANAKIAVLEPDPTDIERVRCMTTYHPIPAGSISWEFRKPEGSNSTLTGTDSLSVSFVPDIVGAYIVFLTVSCPGGCAAPLTEGGFVLAQPQTQGLIVSAVDKIERPPETEPLPPSLSFTSFTPIRDGLDDGGVVDPQWVTTKEWNGPEDYELLEGRVKSSHISRKDSPFNHDSQDFTFEVFPDPPYGRLLNPNQGEMEVEWERDHLPEFFRPTRGDRISTVGYWIYDCGHDFKTEIHPPVMLAVHRPRPILLPVNLGLGANIYVPGIVTDIWVNREGGEMTSNCSATGLHNPPSLNGLITGGCLPDAAGFDENPINRVYEFNIYLPRNPHVVATQAGMVVPPIPLYYENTNPEGNRFDPVITQHQSGDVTYLRVTIDLSEYAGDTYTRRIVAGWAYPSPNNWGLKSWRLRINSIDVDDDGDSFESGDGDWRFWVNITNTDQEWTKLFDCDGCVHGLETFGGTPWATGFKFIPNSLGSDILLFPNQRIWIHSSGFEDDWAWSDSTGHVNQLHPQEARSYSSNSHCESSYPSGCCRYVLNYDILEGIQPGNASLSTQGLALYNAYTLQPNDLSNRPGRPNLVDLVNEFPQPLERNWNHIDDELFLFENQDPVRLDELEFFNTRQSESNVITDMNNDNLSVLFSIAQENTPEKLVVFVDEMIEEIHEAFLTKPRDDVELGLLAFKEVLPPDIWNQIQPHIDAAPTVTPVSTPTFEPSATNTPTEEPASTDTPTNTPTPIPTDTHTPTPIDEIGIYVFDEVGNQGGELTGKTDFDSENSRNLSIYWNMERGNATDWHIYVRKGMDGVKYLGRTGDGLSQQFDWHAGFPNIAPEFSNGPDFNSVYSFRVIRLDGMLGPDDIFDQKAPVGFNGVGGNPINLIQPVMPNLHSGQVSVYDDLLGGNDLAPMDSNGTDVDTDDARAIQIAWNFGVESASVNEYHVHVKVDANDFEFLGQTYSGNITYFWWTPQNRFRTNPKYSDGPQHGHTYQFKVFKLPFSGSRQNLTSGALSYTVQ